MAIELKASPANPFEDVPTLGIATKRFHFVHVGLLYLDDDDLIRLAHLRWHQVFEGRASLEDPHYSNMLWAASNLNPDVREQVATYLALIADRTPPSSIQYGFEWDGEFDEGGVFRPGPMGTGLTCATFVLSVFDSLRIRLVEALTWPEGRDPDIAWGQAILSGLRTLQPIADQEHIRRQEQELPRIVRFRPEEVVAAFATFSGEPVQFMDIEEPSREVLAAIDRAARA